MKKLTKCPDCYGEIRDGMCMCCGKSFDGRQNLRNKNTIMRNIVNVSSKNPINTYIDKEVADYIIYRLKCTDIKLNLRLLYDRDKEIARLQETVNNRIEEYNNSETFNKLRDIDKNLREFERYEVGNLHQLDRSSSKTIEKVKQAMEDCINASAKTIDTKIDCIQKFIAAVKEFNDEVDKRNCLIRKSLDTLKKIKNSGIKLEKKAKKYDELSKKLLASYVEKHKV